MFRLFLILCLTLTTAWGPLCCCCAAQARGASTVSASAKRPACCQRHAAAAKRTPGRSVMDASRSDSPVPARSCPCGVRATLGKAIAATTTSVNAEEGPVLSGFGPGELRVAIVVEILAADASWSSPPAPYGRSLLRAYHILRC